MKRNLHSLLQNEADLERLNMTAAKIVKSWGVCSRKVVNLLQYDIDQGIYQKLLVASNLRKFKTIYHYAQAARAYYYSIKA